MKAGVALAILAKRPWPALLLASSMGWGAAYGSGYALLLPDLCTSMAGAWPAAPTLRSLDATLLINPPGEFVLSWALMLLAMMPPLLTGPVMHIWVRSLARRRPWTIAVFATGYAATWMAAGAVLLAAALALRVLAGTDALPALGLSLAVAAIWQVSPAKRAALDRCHRLPRLSAFGYAADRDCLRYGLTNGLWCVGTCWATMLVVLVAAELHTPLMAAASAIITVERLRPARPINKRIPPRRLRTS